jgi:tape measure domain-containing protein
MADISKSVEIVFKGNNGGLIEAVQKLDAEFKALGFDGLEDGATKAGKSLKDLNQDVEDVNEKVGDTPRAVDGASTAFGALVGVIASWISLETAKQFLDINIAMDRVKFTLEEVTGSTGLAEQQFEFLEKTAYDLGLGITELVKPYAKLYEATKGTNLEGKITEDLFIGIASAGAKLGLSSVEVERALKAIEQIASKGRVSLEEVRGQLGDALPGAVPLFAEAAGVTIDQFFKLVEAGELSSDTLIEVARILNERYGVGEGEKIETLVSSFGRLRTAVELFAAELGEAGINDAIQAFVDRLAAGLKTSADDWERWNNLVDEAKERYATSGWQGIYDAISEYAERSNEAKAVDIFSGQIDQMVAAKLALNEVEQSADNAQNALELLGVEKEKLYVEEVERLAAVLTKVANSGPGMTSQPYFLTRLLEDLNKVDENTAKLDSFREAAQLAFDKGVIDEAGFTAAIQAIDTKAEGLWNNFVGGKQKTEALKPTFEDLSKALYKLADDSEVTGSQFVTGLLGALDKTEETGVRLKAFEDAARSAFDTGKISPEEYQAVLEAIKTKASGLWDEMLRGKDAMIEVEDKTKKANEALKALGVDPKDLKFEDVKVEAEKLLKALDDLAKSDITKGTDWLTGLLSGLDKLKDTSAETLDKFRLAAVDAFESGKISGEEFDAAMNAIDTKASGLWDQMLIGKDAMDKYGEATKKAAEEQDKQAKEIDKARKEAEKLALEFEKLASNERIKLIEAKVTLNVAQIEAQTERVKSAFESLDNTINSTGDLLGKLFGEWDEDASWDKRREIQDQIEKENEMRQKAFELQEKLVTAQIKNMEAQTNRLNNGDALIKIEGDGLQPQLEAFMWEILKAIQVRVNADGLDLLLGGA